MARPNGEVIKGDVEPDDRVVLYVIKGLSLLSSLLSVDEP